MSWKNIHNVFFLRKAALWQMTGSGFIDEPSLELLLIEHVLPHPWPPVPVLIFVRFAQHGFPMSFARCQC